MRSMNNMLAALSALAVAFSLHVSAEAQVSRDPLVEQAYQEGLQLLQSEDYEGAIAKFTEATQVDDTFAEAFLGIGDALRELEDFQAALQAYTKARDRNQSLARVHFGLGMCHKELGQLDLAVNDFSNAIDLDRRDPEILANFGKLYLDVQNPASALKTLESAADLDPNNAEVHRDLGWARIQMGQTDEGIDDLQRSIEIDPKDYETYYRLATVHLHLEEYREAVEALSNTIKFYEPEETGDPNDFITGYMVRSETLIKLAGEEETAPEEREKLFQQVIDDANFILEKYPDRETEMGSALYHQGVAMRMLMRYGEATKALTESIQLAVSSGAGYTSEAYLKRGICWLKQGEPDLARGDFEQSAALNYADPLPYLWIGFTHAYEEDYRKAIDSYGEAIAKNPRQTSAYVNRGLAYMQQQGYRKAVENFNEAIRLEPTNSEHFYKRGVAYMWKEEYEKAFTSFELAVLYNDKHAKSYRAGAQALRALDRGNLAEQYDRRANELGDQEEDVEETAEPAEI